MDFHKSGRSTQNHNSGDIESVNKIRQLMAFARRRYEAIMRARLHRHSQPFNTQNRIQAQDAMTDV